MFCVIVACKMKSVDSSYMGRVGIDPIDWDAFVVVIELYCCKLNSNMHILIHFIEHFFIVIESQ